MLRRSFVILVLAAAVAAVSTACRGGGIQDLTTTEAEAGLRSSSTFTTRPDSPVGRVLVDIVAIRRIGNSSTEVEFTWHDTVPPKGQADAPIKTSMALFRLRDDGTWGLRSLYKVQ